MVVLDSPVNVYGWELVAKGDNDKYRMYKHENGYFQIAIIYEINGKVYERSVSNSKGKSFEEYLSVLEYFEKEANYDELVEKKEKARLKRSVYISGRNKNLFELGDHQFQTNPEIVKNGAARSKELWEKANNGEFEHEGHKEWTERKREEKRENSNSNKMKELWEKAKKGEYESEHHKDWTEKVRNNSGFGNPCAIIKYNEIWTEGDGGKSLEIRNKHISNAIKNIQDYNEKVKIDPILREKRSEIQSKTSKRNWQNEDYRRAVINGLLNAIKIGKWTPPYKNSIKGWHYSPKNKKSFYFRSSYEKLMYTALDSSKEVERYDTERFRVEYKFEGKLHITLPDLFIVYTDGLEVLCEVKTEYMLRDEQTKAKLRALRKFSKKRGYTFWLVTEKELGEMGLL